MRLFRYCITAALLAAGTAIADPIEDALSDVDDLIQRFQNVYDVTLTYSHEYEQIPLGLEGASYLAGLWAERRVRSLYQMRDRSVPLQLTAEQQETYNDLYKRHSIKYQKKIVKHYEYKIRITNSSFGGEGVSKIHESISNSKKILIMERTEDDGGTVTVAQKINGEKPYSEMEMETTQKSEKEKKTVIPLPLLWTRFFNRTPKYDLKYEVIKDATIQISFRHWKTGVSESFLTLRLAKWNDRYVPVCWETKRKVEESTYKFMDYVERSGLILPKRIELASKSSEEYAKTPQWVPFIVRYTLK